MIRTDFIKVAKNKAADNDFSSLFLYFIAIKPHNQQNNLFYLVNEYDKMSEGQ